MSIGPLITPASFATSPCASHTLTITRPKGNFAMTALLNELLEWMFSPALPRLNGRELKDTLGWLARTEVRPVHVNLMECV